MPERRSIDEFETTAIKGAMPVWAPNPGVPVIARMLAFIFGGLMLLTVFATCLTPRAPDIPPIPNAETDWRRLDTKNGCVLYYPRGWIPEPQSDGEQFNMQFSLCPGSLVQVTAILEEATPNTEYLATDQINSRLEADLQDKLDNFTLTEGTLTTIAANGRAFTFTKYNRPMSGAWVIQPEGRFLLCLIGFAPRDGWEATQIIISQMATKAVCPK